MHQKELSHLNSLVGNSLEIKEDGIKVVDPQKFRGNIHKLVEVSTLETGRLQALSRYCIRAAALDMGILPASIHELYTARGRGDIPADFTVPAINLRVLSFDAARAVFRAALRINAAALIFEIARSEIGYTDQKPAEYAANILAAAAAENFTGPVFIQGDHFQVSAGRYQDDPAKEMNAVKELAQEAIEAGFFNIDVDTSTLVDLDQETIPEQQALNAQLSAEITAHIRSLEPEGITISVGGEIGEVGGKNSTAEELRAYTQGFNQALKKIDSRAEGLSKISIQTGTSHGGVVLPDGTIASVNVDFDTLLELSVLARKEYGMAGAVQHGASTLPQDAFGKFVESEACEVHLATNFQNIFYVHVSSGIKSEMYAYLDANHANERKPGMTDDQFYYKSRKRALGPFKSKIWNLPQTEKENISKAWEKQFSDLFDYLAIKNTKEYVDKFVKPVAVPPQISDYLKGAGETQVLEDSSDLAD